MIRPAAQNDLLAIGHVYCQSWKAAYKGIIPDDYLNSLTDENCAPSSISCNALVYESAEQIVGVAAFGPRRDQPDSKTGELYSIYVLPGYWQRGAGRALFEAVRSRLQAEGYDSFMLWALTGNERAARFYERMGMRPCGSRTISIAGRDLPETGFYQTLN